MTIAHNMFRYPNGSHAHLLFMRAMRGNVGHRTLLQQNELNISKSEWHFCVL